MYDRDLGFFAVIVQLVFGLSAAHAIEPPGIIDLIPQDVRVLESLSGNPEARVERFSKEVLDAHPEVYQRLWRVDPAQTKVYVERAPGYVARIGKLHSLFESQAPAILDRFCQAYPEFDPAKAKIYLMLSLCRFDAKIPSQHPDSLLIGLDGLARFHATDAPLGAILYNELFHLYHFQINPLPKNPDNLPLYLLLCHECLPFRPTHHPTPEPP